MNSFTWIHRLVSITISFSGILKLKAILTLVTGSLQCNRNARLCVTLTEQRIDMLQTRAHN